MIGRGAPQRRARDRSPCRLKPGLFILVPFELGREREYLGNPYVAARELAGTPEYYVSHASAMDLHQMVTQPQLAIFVTSPRRSGCVPCSGRSSASCAASRRTCLASSTGLILGAGVNCVVRKFVNRACLLPKCATTENYASRVSSSSPRRGSGRSGGVSRSSGLSRQVARR